MTPTGEEQRPCGGYMAKRGTAIVPEEAQMGNVGKYVFVNAVVQNGTKWPWKANCIVRKIEGEAIVEDIVIQEALGADSLTEIVLPIKLPENAGEYTIKFGFFDPNGKQFGSTFEVKLKAEQAPGDVEDVALLQAAINLVEKKLGNFEACLNALKSANGDETKAAELLRAGSAESVTEGATKPPK